MQFLFKHALLNLLKQCQVLLKRSIQVWLWFKRSSDSRSRVLFKSSFYSITAYIQALVFYSSAFSIQVFFDSSAASIQALAFYSRAVSIQARLKSKLSHSIQARLLFLTLKNQMMNDHDVCFVSDFDFLIGLCSKILMKT